MQRVYRAAIIKLSQSIVHTTACISRHASYFIQSADHLFDMKLYYMACNLTLPEMEITLPDKNLCCVACNHTITEMQDTLLGWNLYHVACNHTLPEHADLASHVELVASTARSLQRLGH